MGGAGRHADSIAAVVGAPELSTDNGGPARRATSVPLITTHRISGHFPSDEATMTRMSLASRTVTATWTHPPLQWAATRVLCAMPCGDRFRLDDSRTTMADTHHVRHGPSRP